MNRPGAWRSLRHAVRLCHDGCATLQRAAAVLPGAVTCGGAGRPTLMDRLREPIIPLAVQKVSTIYVADAPADRGVSDGENVP